MYHRCSGMLRGKGATATGGSMVGRLYPTMAPTKTNGKETHSLVCVCVCVWVGGCAYEGMSVFRTPVHVYAYVCVRVCRRVRRWGGEGGHRDMLLKLHHEWFVSLCLS